MKKKSVIIDVDTGIDDAVALCLATYSDKLNVKLITTVCGNQDVGEVTKNTLNLLQKIKKRRIQVAVGAKKPWKRKKDYSIQAHGRTGLGNYTFPELELKPSKITAIDKMYDVIRKSKDKITIICLGPLTNIAKLLMTHSKAKDGIESIVISAGLLDDDKNNPYLGFNVFQDPESAEYVLNSDVNIIICPSDLGHIAYLTPEEISIISKTNETGEMLSEIFKVYKDRHVKIGAATHDPCAITLVTNPRLFKKKKMFVSLRYLHDENNNGVIDFDTTKKPNMIVATKINIKKFKKLFFESLNKMP